MCPTVAAIVDAELGTFNVLPLAGIGRPLHLDVVVDSTVHVGIVPWAAGIIEPEGEGGR